MFSIWQQHTAVHLSQEKEHPEACRVLHHQPCCEWLGPDSVPLPHGDNFKFLPQVQNLESAVALVTETKRFISQYGWLAVWLPVSLQLFKLLSCFPFCLLLIHQSLFSAFVLRRPLSHTPLPSHTGGCMGKPCAPCTLFVACCLASAVWPL